jgi:hypothetical protein
MFLNFRDVLIIFICIVYVSYNLIFSNPKYNKNEKIIVFGDFHGQLSKLKKLFNNLEKKLGKESIYNDYTLLFIGDYVDRGPEIKDGIEFLINLKKSRKKNTTVFIIGNHDFALSMYLGLFQEPYKNCFKNTHVNYKGDWDIDPALIDLEDIHLQGKRYVKAYTGNSTLKSYNSNSRTELLNNMPNEHIQFFKDLDWIHETEKYIFVHAGFDKNRGLKEQKNELFRKDVSIDRIEQLCNRNYYQIFNHPDTNKIIVSGHVRVNEVKIEEKRILCDTSGGLQSFFFLIFRFQIICDFVT